MAQIEVSAAEFPDIVVNFLLDLIANGADDLNNPAFKLLVQTLKSLGARSPLITYFLHEDAINRIKYRMVRSVLMGKATGTARLIVAGGNEETT